MFRTVFLAFVTVLGVGPTAVAAPPAPSDGPLGVAVADGLTLRDAARGKDLAYKVSYPEGDGPYPLIVFSHGFGGNKDAFATIARHWAGSGYVVIQPTHADGLGRRDGDRTAAGGRPGRPGAGGLLAGLNDPDRIADRVADLVLVLDSLAEIEKATPALEGRIDSKRIGVGGQGVDWRKEPYRFSPPGSKYLVVIEGANHLSFGGGLGPRGSGVTDVVKLTSTLFWDAFLKDSEPARAYLHSDELPKDAGGSYAFEKK